MLVVTLDDERLALENLTDTVHSVLKDAKIYDFRYGEDVIEFASQNKIDIAFLDVQMRTLTGVEVAEQIIKFSPSCNIIFTTGFNDYTSDAMRLHASGYIMKPVTEEKVRFELAHLRFPIENEIVKPIKVKCFGNFEIFHNNKPITFKYKKTKEIFAYLVDRQGSYCSNGEILGILFEDEADNAKSSYLANLKSDLFATFDRLNCSDVLCKERGSIALIPDNIDCDYYVWLKDKERAQIKFNGEYMSQYSWAEYTLSSLLDY